MHQLFGMLGILGLLVLVVVLANQSELERKLREMFNRCSLCGRLGSGIDSLAPGFGMQHCPRCRTRKTDGTLTLADITEDNAIHPRWMCAHIKLGLGHFGVVGMLNDGKPAVLVTIKCDRCGKYLMIYLRPTGLVGVDGGPTHPVEVGTAHCSDCKEETS